MSFCALSESMKYIRKFSVWHTHVKFHTVNLMLFLIIYYRSVKLPAVTKALQCKKQKSAASPLNEDPVTVDDDEDEREVKTVTVKDTAKSTSHKKELSVDIEVMTLKPAVKTEGKRQSSKKGNEIQIWKCH